MEISEGKWRISIADDNLSAKLLLEAPEEGGIYSPQEILAFLRKSGVTHGLIYSEVEDMVQKHIYYKEVVVARGRDPIDGVDGYYDFFFDMGQIKSPAIRSDGTVDYQSMNIVHSVNKDELLAVYHPPVAGTHGYDIKGRERRAKVAKPLPELKGSGFSFSTDRDGTVTYKATIEGRVEYNNFKLFVRDIYEHKGDLDLLTGRVDFLGDVVIHGSVRAGTVIKASKSITVEGNVEAAVIIAGGDIVLKKGMQGGKKAKLSSGGDIYAYFLEYTDVTAKGSVEANIILNCNVTAGKSIVVKGKRGAIVGGSYNAPSLISATNMGNQAEVRTIAAVGISEEKDLRNHLLMTKLEATKRGLGDSKKKLEGINDSRVGEDTPEVRRAKAAQIQRHIKRDERLIEHLEKEIEEIRQSLELARGAKVVAEGNAFKGLVIRIDNKEKVLDESCQSVEFYRPGVRDEIEIRTVGSY